MEGDQQLHTFSGNQFFQLAQERMISYINETKGAMLDHEQAVKLN